ncbi:hypothetical protein JTE90_022919, partial [Oedothorax gibbosus]
FNSSYLHLVEYAFLALGFPFSVPSPGRGKPPDPHRPAQADQRNFGTRRCENAGTFDEKRKKYNDTKDNDKNFDIRQFFYLTTALSVRTSFTTVT